MTKLSVKPVRWPGISFVIRCRNESEHLRECIGSLRGLRIPYEIVLLLHQCTDQSLKIAYEFQEQGCPINIYHLERNISRPGFETLVTPTDHPQSYITMCNQAFSWAKKNWLMKWDADFVATPELIEFLNTLDPGEEAPKCVKMNCVLGDNEHVTKERYLTNCLLRFEKHVFWEVPFYTTGEYEDIEIDAEIHSISPATTKDYWREVPWFLEQDDFLAFKYQKVTDLLRPEEPGLAKAGNPEGDKAYFEVVSLQSKLNDYGIELHN